MVEAFGERAGAGGGSAERHGHVLALAAFHHVLIDRVELLLVDDSTHVGGLVERVAHDKRTKLVDERTKHLVVDVLVQEQTGPCRAALALTGEAARE